MEYYILDMTLCILGACGGGQWEGFWSFVLTDRPLMALGFWTGWAFGLMEYGFSYVLKHIKSIFNIM